MWALVNNSESISAVNCNKYTILVQELRNKGSSGLGDRGTWELSVLSVNPKIAQKAESINLKKEEKIQTKKQRVQSWAPHLEVIGALAPLVFPDLSSLVYGFHPQS